MNVDGSLTMFDCTSINGNSTPSILSGHLCLGPLLPSCGLVDLQGQGPRMPSCSEVEQVPLRSFDSQSQTNIHEEKPAEPWPGQGRPWGRPSVSPCSDMQRTGGERGEGKGWGEGGSDRKAVSLEGTLVWSLEAQMFTPCMQNIY